MREITAVITQEPAKISCNYEQDSKEACCQLKSTEKGLTGQPAQCREKVYGPLERGQVPGE